MRGEPVIVDFEMEGLKAFKRLHQIWAGVRLKHLNSKATTDGMDFGEMQAKMTATFKNWIIKASSVVRSPETFRDLRNLAWLRTAIQSHNLFLQS